MHTCRSTIIFDAVGICGADRVDVALIRFVHVTEGLFPFVPVLTLKV